MGLDPPQAAQRLGLGQPLWQGHRACTAGCAGCEDEVDVGEIEVMQGLHLYLQAAPRRCRDQLGEIGQGRLSRLLQSGCQWQGQIDPGAAVPLYLDQLGTRQVQFHHELIGGGAEGVDGRLPGNGAGQQERRQPRKPADDHRVGRKARSGCDWDGGRSIMWIEAKLRLRRKAVQ